MAQMSLMPVPDFSASAVPGRRLDGRHGVGSVSANSADAKLPKTAT